MSVITRLRGEGRSPPTGATPAVNALRMNWTSAATPVDQGISASAHRLVPRLVGGNADSNDVLSQVTKLGICAATGMVFGIALEKSRVFKPFAIQDLMLLENVSVLKMFLAAQTSGTLALMCMSACPASVIADKCSDAIGHRYTSCFKNKGVLSTALGAIIMGAGVALAGSGPFLLFPQLGAGVENALQVLFGGVAGAFAFGLVEKTLTELLKPSEPITCYSLHKYLNCPYYKVAFPIALTTGLATAGLELWKPWTDEVEGAGTVTLALSTTALPAVLMGAVVGLTQVPLVLALKETLGNSSMFCTVASWPLVTEALRSLSAYITKFRKGGVSGFWQVALNGGAVLGAYISARASGTLGSSVGVSSQQAFWGGFLMIFGSRLGGGCTSGHIISGFNAMSLLSFVSFPCFLAGGIGTAAILKKTGVL